MKLSMLVAVAWAIVAGGVVQSVFAREYWVDPNGSDSYDGTSSGWEGGESLVGPKKTLAGVMAVANKKGDIVYAAEGEYREGTMGTGTTLDRVQIPAGVSLIGAGPGKSFIIGEDAPLENQCEGAFGCGEGAVRCVHMMGDDTILKGFTICNGRVHCTKWGGAGGDTVNKYAGVMAYHNGNMGYPGRSVIVDCLISNCVANTCAVSRDGLFINCRVVDCRVGWYMGLENPIAYNCYFDNITGTYALNSPLLVMNCTFGATKSNLRMQGAVKHVYNSVFLGDVAYQYGGSQYFALHDCRYRSGIIEGCDISDGTRQMAVEAMQLGADGISPLSSSPLLDQGKLDQYFNNTNIDSYSSRGGWDTNCNWFRSQIQKYATVDLNGNPRVQNGAIDLGCVEYDRREEFAKALALQRVEVTEVTSNVFLSVNGEVELRDDGGIGLIWQSPTGSDNQYLMHTEVQGEGTLEFRFSKEDEEPFAVVTEADGVTNIVFDGYISEVEVYASYTGSGKALLSSFKDVAHVAIARERGGLAVTGGGVEIGEERMVSPSNPCTFTVSRADDTERLCTGFNASSASGVVYYDFAEHPDGVEFTVDGLTTSVDISPVYAANQRYYVDAVNGSDTDNHGCFSNSAYRTIMRACTNAYLVAGDEICLFPGVYDDGAAYHAEGAKTLNRVILPYGVNLTGIGETPADVVVAGAEAPEENQVDGQYGCGLDATRCIYLKGDNVVRDLTVADGHAWVQDDLAKCDFYAGIHAKDASSDCYVINCTVTGCVSRYQAVVGEDKLSLIRCHLHHNRATWYAVLFNAKCYNCYFNGNYGSYTIMNSPEMVNCTFAQISEAFTFRNDNCKLYNSVTFGNQQRLGYYYRSYMKGYGYDKWPVAEGHLLDGSVTNTFTEAWVGNVDPAQTPATPSRRSDLFDAGNNAYLDLFPARFPEEKLIDFLGNPRIQGASVDVGAIEKLCPGAMLLIQ